jgi:tRNA A-37 threonylcarbamoyl transferase component Bud32/tetratricopeptide (TPR) repeat protein
MLAFLRVTGKSRVATRLLHIRSVGTARCVIFSLQRVKERDIPETVIQIPGYRILRQLGRGGMATVYLALQESVDREVALKVMNRELLSDPSFGERFLREARIAAKLHHRHVVAVHDVGRIDDVHYIAMEYLSGGPILKKDGNARDVPFALRVTREIATALDYAHRKSFIHRDVKPDNILLRDDLSSALTDFGIARASDSATRMTKTGAVVGTPFYMSPEQARGRTLDGRADLYSLGVVLYELLVGRVPFMAEDSLAVGIMHITDPPPSLPEALSGLQPMLDIMLAKRPEDRYQTGAEMAHAVREYEVAIAQGELPSLHTPTPHQRESIMTAVPALAPAAPVVTPAPDARGRSEPVFGDGGFVPEVERPRRVPAATRGRGRWLWVLLVLVVLGGGGAALWFNQDRLRELLPDTRQSRLLAEAERAFAADRLTGAAGDSALELYRKVQQLDADNAAALDGVRKVGERLLARARDRFTAGDLSAAQVLLGEARAVMQGGAALDGLERELRAAQLRVTSLEDVLQRASTALAEGQLIGDEDSALVLFRRALEIDPHSGLARKGLDDIAAALARSAEAAIVATRLDEAEATLAQIELVRASYERLPALRVSLAEARAAATREIDTLLEKGAAQLRASRFVTPRGDNARETYEAVLARAPDNAAARAGLARVAEALLVRASAVLDAGDIATPEALLRQAEALGAPTAEVRALRTRLREQRERLEIAAAQPVLNAEQIAKVEKYLGDADAALASGELNEPPGGNAYDLYRAALALDRRNERALAGLGRIPDRARELFDAALAEGRPNRARTYLDAFAQTSRDANQRAVMRARLATAYLAQGERQLTAGQRDAATRSLERARELAPTDPAIAAFAERLAAAGG